MPDIILSSRNKPFSTRAYAEKNIPEGYQAVEQDGGWVGVKDTAKPKDVICPGCGGMHYETTDAYDPDKAANSAMISLKQKYRDWGWEGIYPDPDSGYGILVCPDCGTALAPSGKLRIDND